MKKILAGFFIVMFAAIPFAKAEENLSDAEMKSPGLVDLQMSRTSSKVDDLERRIQALERDRKSQDDKIRNVERAVDDLKRRR